MKIIASFLSFIFQPSIAPTMCLVIFHLFYPHILMPFVNEYFSPLLLLIFIGTYVLPSFAIIIIKITGIIQNYDMDSRLDRIKAGAVVLLIWGFVFFSVITKFQLSDTLKYLFFSQMIVLVLVSFINYFFKFSIHTFTISFLVVLVGLCIHFTNSFEFLPIFCFIILIAGTIGWARMYLQKHTLWQLSVGYLFGALLGAVCMLFLK